jgi:tetratricopeptide (TPR) repeat protein
MSQRNYLDEPETRLSRSRLQPPRTKRKMTSLAEGRFKREPFQAARDGVKWRRPLKAKRNQKTPAKPERPQISVSSIPPFRRAVYLALAMVVVPLALFAMLEIGLRVFGAGYPTSFFLKTKTGQGTVLVENQKFGWRFFPRALAREPRPMAIPAKKPAGTLRVFVFGESAAYGDPDPAFGLPRVLEVLLRERFPGERFEVVNVAMTAINSHVILPIARECAQREGDFWVIYMGNNEVVGPFGPGTVFSKQSPPLQVVRATIALQKLKLAQVMDAAVQRIGARKVPQTFTGMDMFSENRVASDDPRMTRVYENFERNLRDIVAEGLQAKVPIVLCTVGVNLRDCAPFASAHRSNLSSAEKTDWEELFASGVSAQQKLKFANAAESFRAAMKIDDHYAEALFRLGQCELTLGNTNESAKLFRRARDEDALRFRADSRENDIVRKLQQAVGNRGVHLVDVEKLLGELPGSEYFYEHVHFNFAGNYLLARAVAEKVAQQVTSAKNGKWLSEKECAERLALTDFSRAKIAELLRKRTTRPPFTFQFDHEQRDAESIAEVRKLRAGLTSTAMQEARGAFERAIKAWPEDWTLHENFAGLLAALNDFDMAATHSREVVTRLDHHPEKWSQLGLYLQRAGKTREASEAFQHALKLNPRSPEAQYGEALIAFDERQFEAALNLLNRALKGRPLFPEARVAKGESFAQLGRTAEAIAEFEKVLELDPENMKARAALNKLRFGGEGLKNRVAELQKLASQNPRDDSLIVLYGKALDANGQLDEAKKQFAAAVTLNPENGEAHYFLGEALTREKLNDQAIDHFEKAAQLMPNDVSAHLNLGVALAQQRRFREALAQFETVLKLEPTHQQAQEYATMARANAK